MKNTNCRYPYMALACAASVWHGCGLNRDSAADGATMNAALSAVQTAVAACAEQRASCEVNLEDASLAADCQDAFLTCKDDAIAAAAPDLKSAVSLCAEQSRTCRKAAATREEATRCSEQLKQCVADNTAAAASDASAADDAGPSAEPSSPVSACTSALRTCIEGDQPAKTCTDQLRDCLSVTLPNFGQGRGDAGKPRDPKPPRDGGVDSDPDGDEDVDEDADEDEGAEVDAEVGEDAGSDPSADGGLPSAPAD